MCCFSDWAGYLISERCEKNQYLVSRGLYGPIDNFAPVATRKHKVERGEELRIVANRKKDLVRDVLILVSKNIVFPRNVTLFM